METTTNSGKVARGFDKQSGETVIGIKQTGLAIRRTEYASNQTTAVNNDCSLNGVISDVVWKTTHISEDPAIRRYQIYQIAEDKIDQLVYSTELARLSNICTIKKKFSDEITKKIVEEELKKGCLFSKAEILKKIKACTYVRMPSWFDALLRQDLEGYQESIGILPERDEEGNVCNWGRSSSSEWTLPDDRLNSYTHSPLEIMIAKEETSLLDRGINIMASLKTRNSRRHLAIIAAVLDRQDLVDGTELIGLTKQQLIILNFHARQKLAKIIESLCSATRKRQEEHDDIRRLRKSKKSTLKNLKKIYKKNTPLFNPNEKNGKVIIIYKKGQSEALADNARSH